jgi:AcrR family transcriptional regulator
MPPRAKDTKRQIMDAAYDRFYKDGFARTSVDAIAAAAGVTKRTFYYHFDSKDALVSAVLAIQHELILSRIQRWAQPAAGDPAAIVKVLFAKFSTWAGQPRWRGSGFTRAAMEFAHSPGHPARVAARRQKAAVEGWLAEQFARNGIETSRSLARQVMLLLEGCNALILIHGDKSYADAASAAAQVLVERHPVCHPLKPVRSPASR